MLLVPYGTDAPLYHLPLATVGVGVTYLAVLAGVYSGQLEDIEFWVLHYGAGLEPVQWLTATFLHAGVLHVAGNLAFLWTFGLIVEGKIGWWRFLLVYVVLAGVSGLVEQLVFWNGEGASLGGSGVIFGLMAMALVWAPENEVSVFWCFGFRPGTFETPIATFGFCMLVFQVAIAWWQGFSLSSELLHLVGGVAGLGLGLAMLQLDWVDCEGWDLISRWRGEPDRWQPRESKVPDAQQSAELARETTLARFRRQLADGLPGAALELHNASCARVPGWELPERELHDLIKALHAEQRFVESMPLMAEFARRFPAAGVRVRLRLAQLLITVQCRPRKALAVLAELPGDPLSPQLEAARGQLIRRANRLIADGELEVDVEDF